jgi:B12-binding domain/radical SAM domain protein of rhizo-twelve system
MRIALVNPAWSFEGSIYFGCREPHLPLELGYARALLAADGHDVRIADGQLDGLSLDAIASVVDDFAPDLAVVTTAPSYLFWRCAPPELRVPIATIDAIRDSASRVVVIGPHASTTPAATLRKTGADAVVLGESEETLRALASVPFDAWSGVDHLASIDVTGAVRLQGGLAQCDMSALPALAWEPGRVASHAHHHHRFEAPPRGPGAEMETSRGCPYHCSFCAKENFRNAYRKRPLPVILDEVDRLLAQGVEYVYFIDEIFLPNKPLLEALVRRPVIFGVQTRIDLWSRDMLDLLGAAGCVSIEAGVESISEQGRNLLDKQSRLSTDEITARLVHARSRVPFVQANLIDARVDDAADVQAWREHLRQFGVWANEPVPLFPYPGSPDYAKLWGPPDDEAWERAHAYYLERHVTFSDIQDARPRPLAELERTADAR